jgi:hypothetical protein
MDSRSGTKNRFSVKAAHKCEDDVYVIFSALPLGFLNFSYNSKTYYTHGPYSVNKKTCAGKEQVIKQKTARPGCFLLFR